MAKSINRLLADAISPTGDINSSALDNVDAGLTVYSALDSLPTSNLTVGDQAYVSSNSRMYISNGSGWYNVALINATPSLTVSPSGTITLATDGASPTVITLTATDSDNSDASLVLSVDSGGDFYKIATLTQDSSVFTITPRTEDSATTLGFDGSATLTFKASDGISFGSQSTTFNLSFNVPNSQYTDFMVKADTAGTDNQVDASTNTHTITETGNVTSNSLTPYHPGGYSTYFSSAANRIVTNLTGSGTDAWTIEWWVYHTANSGTSSQNRNFGAATNDPMFLNSNLNSPTLYIGGQSRVSASHNMPIGQWYHIALVRSVTSNTIKLYIDGVLEGTSAVQAGTTYDIPAKPSFGVGSDANFTAYGMTGFIRDFRYVIGTEVYTSAFTPPSSSLTAIAGTDLLLCNNPAPVDVSGNYNAVTVTGAIGKRVSPYTMTGKYDKSAHGGSVYFDGTDDYLTGPTPATMGIGTGDFTIECWFNATAADTDKGIWDAHTTSSSADGLTLTRITATTFRVWATSQILVSSATLITNAWNHLAVVRNSGTLELFVNGVSQGTVANSTNLNSTQPFVIGSGRYQAGSVPNKSVTGHISDFRITTTAVYTSNFTPPTEPLTAIANTQLLTCTNKNSIWDASGINEVIKAGNATASNTQRKFTTSSAISFDGSGDYIGWDEGGHVGTYANGSNDQTIEMWVYPNANSNYQTLFSMNRGTSTGFNFGIDGASRPFLWKGNFRIQTGTVSNTTWSHVALVRYNGVWSIYVNGTSVGSTWADTTTYTGQDFALGDTVASGGGTSGEWFNGYMQDARYTKGLARYTTNFTPPTSEFDG